MLGECEQSTHSGPWSFHEADIRFLRSGRYF